MYQPSLSEIRVELADSIVLPAEHAYFPQRLEIQQLRTDAVIHVVVVVGDFIDCDS